MDAAGDEKVPCALRCGADQDGRFNFDEAVFIKIIPRYLGNFVPHQKIALQIRAPQVKVAVFQPSQLRSGAVLNDFKRRRFAICQYAQILHRNFNLTSRNFPVFTGSFAYRPLSHEHILTAHGKCLIENIFCRALVEGELDNAGAVAQINEDQRAEIALALHPAAHGHGFANILHAQIAAVICSFEPCHCVHYRFPPKSACKLPAFSSLIKSAS